MAETWKKEYLWLCMLALGFDPEDRDDCAVLGLNMFDKPNHGAFYLITEFLFAKLDSTRATEIFKYFSVGNVTIPELRKQCCKWLKEIADEDQNHLLQITPSSLIFPAGRKVINVLYWFARGVMIEDLETNSIDSNIPYAEAVKLEPENVYLANARCRVAYNKLLQIFQKEDFVIQEYEKKAKLLLKQIKQTQTENAFLEAKFCKMKQNDQNGNGKMERIQKVRSMWTLIMEMLTSLKREKELVDSVLDIPEDCADQCILDGKKVIFRVPQLLVCRLERDVHQRCTGNAYEGEKLNFLTVVQLLNEALRTLRGERCQSELNQQIQDMENRIMERKKVLQDLQVKSLKVEQQHCVPMSGSISKKQEDWEVKWKNFLGLCPIKFILDQCPDLGASQPRCVDVAEDDEDSFLYQHLLSVSNDYDSSHEVRYEEDGGVLETVMDESTALPGCPLPHPSRLSSVSLELSEASENKDVLIEKNLPVDTSKCKKKPPKILKDEKDESAISDMWENGRDHVIQTEPPVKKQDPIEKARDELAEEFAKAVAAESLQGDEGKEMPLEDLISSLAFNTFLTRKQISRTPENLLTEIRSSWRKVVESEESSDTELASTGVVIEEAPMDARHIIQKAADSRSQCPIPASPVVNPPLSEIKFQLSYGEFRPQELMRVSHIIETPNLESEMNDDGRTEEQESSVEDPEEQNFQYVKSMTTVDICSENNSRRNFLPSENFQDSLRDSMLHSYVSPSLSSPSHEVAFLGIWNETLPEELSYIDSDKSASPESYFNVISSACVTGGSKNKGVIKKSKLDEQSLFSPHKALEKTAFKGEEELHEMRNGGKSVSCRSDLSLAPEEREIGEFWSPREIFCLNEEFTKMPSPVSPNERKYSLSSLLISCQQLEEMAAMVQEIPIDLKRKLKDKEQLKEKPDSYKPSSGQNL
ncbi:HAUS augmin-like complex subunit 6 isoform X2 [Phaenicophaeus curvirostris]|uniref:HAUS augmin-like complex subunit 6 isoform X2 n=1 Tax=Phaenicophaeus curvirostris TaxID=33595 RepID=UPI0037F0DE95